MTKSTLKIALLAAAGSLLASAAQAGAISLTDEQMDVVSGGAFVCPVIGTDAVLNAQNSTEINGAYSIIGPTVSVPVGATNGDGSGSPAGSFSSPGDTDYTAIWN